MASVKADDGFVMRLLAPLDEKVYPVKLLVRIWGPRVEFFVRLILVATFFDDTIRTASDFGEHTKQVGEKGVLEGLASASPELAGFIATIALGVGLVCQSVGSLCLLALFQTDAATKVLIAWSVAQPILYAQLSNGFFVSRSVSLVGGLFMLRAHLASEQAKRDDLSSSGLNAPGGAERAAIARTQLLGRVLLPAVYLHQAGLVLLAMFADSLSMFVLNTSVFGGLVVVCTLVAAGLRSRTVALALALINLGFIFYQYPLHRFVIYDEGEWKYDETEMRKSMPPAALAYEVTPADLEPWQIYDLNRYYFFQGLSTSGALLLLAQFGPGEIALQDDEVLLPLTQRAQD
jgi:hypothetical protein